MHIVRKTTEVKVNPSLIVGLYTVFSTIAAGSVAVVAALHDRWWIVLAVGLFHTFFGKDIKVTARSGKPE